jgi:post-segregation antitoxin (ccd killing protein)
MMEPRMTDRMRSGLGVRAQKGGAVVVALALKADAPSLIVSAFITTHAEGDRLAFEPYAVASEAARDGTGDAAALVAEGRKRQDRMAVEGLRSLAVSPDAAALLVNRAGWITDLLSYSLGWPEHVPVAEGLAVRQAFRTALAELGLQSVELDEKSLYETAETQLNLSQTAIEAQLKAFGATAGKPWRKEQKLAALAAWVAAAGAETA